MIYRCSTTTQLYASAQVCLGWLSGQKHNSICARFSRILSCIIYTAFTLHVHNKRSFTDSDFPAMFTFFYLLLRIYFNDGIMFYAWTGRLVSDYNITMTSLSIFALHFAYRSKLTMTSFSKFTTDSFFIVCSKLSFPFFSRITMPSFSVFTPYQCKLKCFHI